MIQIRARLADYWESAKGAVRVLIVYQWFMEMLVGAGRIAGVKWPLLIYIVVAGLLTWAIQHRDRRHILQVVVIVATVELVQIIHAQNLTASVVWAVVARRVLGP